MDIWHVFQMLGGLALFLYGMEVMGKGLELLAGNKLQKILEKLTNKKLLGVLVGALITAVIQSSSATTVMVVGFVNSKLMTLNQAVNIIMGANIGTTITGQLMALNVNKIAPFIAFIGMLFLLFGKKRKRIHAGQIIIGVGFLFMGMGIMTDAMAPLNESEKFISLMAGVTNPFVAILIGTIVTAVIQSSAASQGILQALASQGLVDFRTSFYIILGQNIGTCVTSLIASTGANKNAKRAATSHVLFNILGTLIFAALASFTPLIPFLKGLSNNPKQQIANIHIIFNISTTLLLLPFSKYIAMASTHLIKGSDDEEDSKKLIYLNKQSFGDSIVMISNLKQELIRMLDVSKTNFQASCNNFLKYTDKQSATIRYNEEIINFLNTEITRLSVKTMSNQLGKYQYNQLSGYLTIASNVERVGDYSISIDNVAIEKNDKDLIFTDTALEELEAVFTLINKMFDEINYNLQQDIFKIKKIYTTAYRIDSLIESNRDSHVERMKNGTCVTESGLLYDKLCTYLGRVSDHLVNIAEAFESMI